MNTAAVDVVVGYLRNPIDCSVPDAQRREAEAIVKSLEEAGFMISRVVQRKRAPFVIEE